jgi:hypothetical protein
VYKTNDIVFLRFSTDARRVWVTKGVIKISKTKKDRQHNGQKKQDLQLHNVPITTDVVGSNLDQGEVYNIIW